MRIYHTILKAIFDSLNLIFPPTAFASLRNKNAVKSHIQVDFDSDKSIIRVRKRFGLMNRGVLYQGEVYITGLDLRGGAS